jgi:hypothetical protein
VLQAFRHLYVLAVEPRSIEAIDVDSRASVFVPLKVTLGPSSQVHIILCLYIREFICLYAFLAQSSVKFYVTDALAAVSQVL